jgi:hypothetical protein
MVLIIVLLTANFTSVSAQTAGNKNVIDKGDFKVGFSRAALVQDPDKTMPKEIVAFLAEFAKPLNKIIALPYDVYLNFDTCGQPNAFYNPTTKEITMCFEFYNEFERAFKKGGTNTEKEVADMSFDVMGLFFFHELGHCLVDVWDLPATGREEDAVDQLAIVILLDGTPEGENMVVNAARWFYIVSNEQGTKNLAFWGEHSLDQQRFYNLMCLTYGSNTSRNKWMVNNKLLPLERAEGCPAEYKRVDRAWERLLTPYLKG